MESRDSGVASGVFVGFLVILFVVAASLESCEQQYKRDQKAAISAGVAEWRIDPTTGEREFVYLTPQEIAARLESEAK